MTLSFDNCQYTSRPTPEVTVMWYPAANPLYMSICQRSFIVSPYLADYVACFCGFIESNASHLLDIRWLICGYSRELVACTEACIQNIRKMHAAFGRLFHFQFSYHPAVHATYYLLPTNPFVRMRFPLSRFESLVDHYLRHLKPSDKLAIHWSWTRNRPKFYSFIRVIAHTAPIP